jgi:hypothetical protein
MFGRQGRHQVTCTLPGYKTAAIEIVVESWAEDEIADVDYSMEKAPGT